MSNSEFTALLEKLRIVAEARPDVVGLAAFGSTAARDRVDEWSDHDFAWITAPGSQDRYRQDLSWLPDHHDIALSVVEHHGGVKVIYDDGHVLEFGVADLTNFATWAGNSIAVLVDKGGVAEAVAHILEQPLPSGDVDSVREGKLLLVHLLIGVGRYRRGEVLSAGRSIRNDAVDELLTALKEKGDSSQLDTLDPRRRFEFVHPDLARRIALASESEPEQAARAILAIAEEQLPELCVRGAQAVRQRLEWS